MLLWKRVRAHIWRVRPSDPTGLRKWKLRRRVGLLGVFAGFALHMAIHMGGFFERYDESDADLYARTFVLDQDWSRHITLVDVDENDYKVIFNSQSPLNPQLLLKLIDAVRVYRPSIVGVDFITDWPSPLPTPIGESNTPVVWVRDGIEDPRVSGSLRLNKVVGTSAPPPDLCFAVPVNPPDPDGTVRHYLESVPARNGDSGNVVLFPTMARVLASVFDDRPLDCRNAPQAPPKRINFTGRNHRFRRLHASDVFRDSSGGRDFGEYLRDHIVIIGGTYSAARDRFPSTGGYKSGLEILAHSVESEISGPIKDLPPFLGPLVGLAFSGLLFLVVFRLHWPFDLLVSWPIVVGYTFLSGWVLYYFGFFSPIASSLFGLPIGVIAEHLVECKALGRHTD
jgi:CHASE2 domain-containing sensor protein